MERAITHEPVEMTPEQIELYRDEVDMLRKDGTMYIVEEADRIEPEGPSEEVLKAVKKAVYKNDEEKLVEILKGIDRNARNWGVAHGKVLSKEDEKKSDDG